MRRRLKNWLIYHAIRMALFAVGLVPRRMTLAVGAGLGRLAHGLARGERARARRHLALALDLPESAARVRALCRGVFVRLGQSAVEVCRVCRDPRLAPKVRIPDRSRAALDEALAGGRGVVFVTGHLGNWEIMAHHLASLGYPISTVAKESYDPRFTSLMDRFRGRSGVGVLYRGRPGNAVGMVRALREGSVLGLFIDQDTRVPGAFVPFFGRMAFTPVGAAVLALRTGAAVVVGSTRRLGNGSHLVEIEGLRIPADPEAATASLTAVLERRIRRHPTQWVWFHERWKTRPPCEAGA
ncbi:MAG: lysophospholipid acyltransferase family protein [Deltaproteobacteria bacterium]|nr:lysophospholipid acyltransferase family protein [Deltaproteobacteria bacterium]